MFGYFFDNISTLLQKKANQSAAESKKKGSYVTRLEKAHYDLKNVPKAFRDSVTDDVLNEPFMIDVAPDHILDKKTLPLLDNKNPYSNLAITPNLTSSEVKWQQKQLSSLMKLKKEIEDKIRNTQHTLTRYENQIKIIDQFERFVSSQEKINALKEQLKKHQEDFNKSIDEIKTTFSNNNNVAVPAALLTEFFKFQEMQYNQSILVLKMELAWELEQFLYATGEVIIEYAIHPDDIEKELDQILKEPLELFQTLQQELEILQKKMLDPELFANKMPVGIPEENKKSLTENNAAYPMMVNKPLANMPSFEQLRHFALVNNSLRIPFTPGLYAHGFGLSLGKYALFPPSSLSMQPALSQQQPPDASSSNPNSYPRLSKSTGSDSN